MTTGLVDELPDVPGLRERWGRDVLHCPYCHGWEVRDQADRRAGHRADVGAPGAAVPAVERRRHAASPTGRRRRTAEQAEQLAARGIPVVTGEVAALEVADDRLTGVRLADGTVIAREVVAVAPRMVARAGLLASLGLRAVEHPSGAGEHIPADPTGRTEVPGVWVAGNVTDLTAQVGTAAAAAASAAAQINADLVAEETSAAVAAYRDPFSAAAEARLAELAPVAQVGMDPLGVEGTALHRPIRPSG